MNIQAIWENGVFRPTAPLALRHRLVTLQVPDEEIASADHLEEHTVYGEDHIDQPPSSLDILRRQYPDDSWLKNLKDSEERILAIPEDQLPELTDKQIERITAFFHRENR